LTNILEDMLQSDFLETNPRETMLSEPRGQSSADSPSHEEPALMRRDDWNGNSGLDFENNTQHARHNASSGSDGEITESKDSGFEPIMETRPPGSDPPSSTENDGTSATNQSERRSESARNRMDEDNGKDKDILLHSRWRFERRCVSNWRLWVAAVCSVAVFAWTVLYSYNATINPDPFLALVQSSLDTRIFLIAFSAQVTILLLNWLTGEIYDCLRWSWITKGGTDLSSFLILNSSTSPLRLIQYLLSRVYLRFTGSGKPCKGRYQPVTFMVCMRYSL
jgi:hypothetical protein